MADPASQPLPKGVVRVMNLETKIPFEITAKSFAEMVDDTYGEGENKKKKFRLLEGEFQPPAKGKATKGGKGAGNADRKRSRQQEEEEEEEDGDGGDGDGGNDGGNDGDN